ncbi:8380_t:CDS:2 [Racocetra persica]|uniref:8380_t:CDS:1 n=1 Tax=Racocetra persica TaxID=160502 RepID=A0ACA9KFU0_9GLOM|nr:8380_t:CDS:2 [Racocetra persica]
MDNKIPIHMVQVNSVTSNGAYRSLKDILFILIPKLAYGKSSVLQLGDIIHIKLSGDGPPGIQILALGEICNKKGFQDSTQ